MGPSHDADATLDALWEDPFFASATYRLWDAQIIGAMGLNPGPLALLKESGCPWWWLEPPDDPKPHLGLTLREYLDACAEWTLALEGTETAEFDASEAISYMELALELLAPVNPPWELLDFHLVHVALLELSLQATRSAQEWEQAGQPDDASFRLEQGVVYMQLRNLGLALDEVRRELNPALAQVMEENGCPVEQPWLE